MNTLAWAITIYGLAWFVTSTLLLVRRAPGPRQPIIDIVVVITLVCLGAVWPVFLVGRVGFTVWHWMGHPGKERFVRASAELLDEQQARRCVHASPMPIPPNHEWCQACGALREKPYGWLPPSSNLSG